MDTELGAETLAILRKDPLKQALTRAAIKDFQISKLFADNKAAITSLDHDLSGARCVTTSLDESLRIYDCVRGTREHVSYSKKYGCNLAQFTTHPGYIAYASTKINDTIRYLSYETNQYLRYFVGHKGMVTSLQRSPIPGSGTILSAAMDGTVNLWDLEQINPVSVVKPTCSSGGSIEVGGIAAAYDPSGTAIAVAVGSTEIQLFDVRKLTRGPFMSSPVERQLIAREVVVAGVQFLPTVGDHMLLAMSNGIIAVLDAFTLKIQAVLSSTWPGAASVVDNTDLSALEKMQQAFLGQNVTAAPDGKTVIVGGESGDIAFWHIQEVLNSGSRHGNGNSGLKSLAPVRPDGSWNGSHDGPVSACAFNPHMMECVSGSRSLALWTTAT
ncbi:WD40 repeat-like protein [Coemansia reversa NRRL 1564]|uniref:WD40 repeat-like protein n=1 Tax=Coemansia reversa (strain ATCC 12441 / NRRL 1564) TaxID=763665 RepID=A0A2G5BH76_COERN|nr:WD40 repeat-like protein [Coemansia reversa NRRL 1564]|eukprot:PIA18341.1 WD40 repeat-like protein [Coemansia reversa NRRL 1564]